MTITIGLVCVVLVCVMFMQFRIVEETDITAIETMREEELREQLASWKTKYEEVNSQLIETNTKLNEYKGKIENNQEASELLDKELNQTNVNLGKTDVEGEGVIITLKDANEQVNATDLLRLVNELKISEAEAISINDERIINMSEMVDVNSYVIVNGQRLTSPFVVKVIGNRKYLEVTD